MAQFISRVMLLIILGLSSLMVVAAQTSTTVEQLRSQLDNVESKETELQTRLKQIDEDLRPENIEKFFALNGSTHPEELRAERRRQLENQKANVQSQLDQLTASRARLEAAITTAEAAAYHQSALPNTSDQSPEVNAGNSPTVKPKPVGRRSARRRARRTRKRG